MQGSNAVRGSPQGDTCAVHDVDQAAGGGHQELAPALQLAQLQQGGRRSGQRQDCQCRAGEEQVRTGAAGRGGGGKE